MDPCCASLLFSLLFSYTQTVASFLKYTRLELARLWISVSQEGITKHGVRSEHLKKDFRSEHLKKDYSEHLKKDFSEHLKKDYSEHLKKDYSNGE